MKPKLLRISWWLWRISDTLEWISNKFSNASLFFEDRGLYYSRKGN